MLLTGFAETIGDTLLDISTVLVGIELDKLEVSPEGETQFSELDVLCAN